MYVCTRKHTGETRSIYVRVFLRVENLMINANVYVVVFAATATAQTYIRVPLLRVSPYSEKSKINNAEPKKKKKTTQSYETARRDRGPTKASFCFLQDFSIFFFFVF